MRVTAPAHISDVRYVHKADIGANEKVVPKYRSKELPEDSDRARRLRREPLQHIVRDLIYIHILAQSYDRHCHVYSCAA